MNTKHLIRLTSHEEIKEGGWGGEPSEMGRTMAWHRSNSLLFRGSDVRCGFEHCKFNCTVTFQDRNNINRVAWKAHDHVPGFHINWYSTLHLQIFFQLFETTIDQKTVMLHHCTVWHWIVVQVRPLNMYKSPESAAGHAGLFYRTIQRPPCDLTTCWGHPGLLHLCWQSQCWLRIFSQ